MSPPLDGSNRPSHPTNYDALRRLAQNNPVEIVVYTDNKPDIVLDVFEQAGLLRNVTVERSPETKNFPADAFLKFTVPADQADMFAVKTSQILQEQLALGKMSACPTQALSSYQAISALPVNKGHAVTGFFVKQPTGLTTQSVHRGLVAETVASALNGQAVRRDIIQQTFNEPLPGFEDQRMTISPIPFAADHANGTISGRCPKSLDIGRVQRLLQNIVGERAQILSVHELIILDSKAVAALHEHFTEQAKKLAASNSAVAQARELVSSGEVTGAARPKGGAAGLPTAYTR